MTLRGILSILFELFLLILALGTEIKEFFVVALCIGGVIAYSFISLFLAVITLHFHSNTDKKELSRNDEVRYTLTMRGPVLLPVVGYLSIKSADFNHIYNKNAMRHTFLLAPTFSIKREFSFDLLCEHVGRWDVGTKKLRVEDMFGLFCLPLLRTRKANFAVKIAVLPKPHELGENDERILVSKGFGGTSFLNSENGELLGDTRLYRKGDALKRINWKQTVRMKKLYTRQYEMPEMPKVLIAMDASCFDDKTGTVADISCESALALANFCIGQDSMVHFVTARGKDDSQNEGYYLQNYADVLDLQQRLLDVSFFSDNSALSLWQLDDAHFANADKVCFITANPSEDLLSDLDDMVKEGRSAVCVVPQVSSEPADSVAKAIENAGSVAVIVKSADEIAGKVGGGL